MKFTRLSHCLFLFAALTFWPVPETQAAFNFTLPPAPKNEADGYVRETLGVPWQSGLGVYPDYSLFTVDIHPGDASPGGAGAPIPIPPIPGIRYAGWCFDTGADINPGGPDNFSLPGTWYGGALYSSLDPDMNNHLPGPPHLNVKQGSATWNKINWIINHRQLPLPCAGGVVPTMFEVQRAIWVIFNQTIASVTM